MSIKLFGRFGDRDVERVVPSLPLFARLAHCELLLSDEKEPGPKYQNTCTFACGMLTLTNTFAREIIHPATTTNSI
jgi:hypothetical protein